MSLPRPWEEIHFRLGSVISISFGSADPPGESYPPYNERTWVQTLLAGRDDTQPYDPGHTLGPYRAFFPVNSQRLRDQFSKYVIGSVTLVLDGVTVLAYDEWRAGGGYLGLRVESVDEYVPPGGWEQITGKNYPSHGSWKSSVVQTRTNLYLTFDVTDLIQQVIYGQRTIYGLALVYVPEESYFPGATKTAYLMGYSGTGPDSEYGFVINYYDPFVEHQSHRYDTRIRLDGLQDSSFDTSVKLYIPQNSRFDTQVDLYVPYVSRFDTFVEYHTQQDLGFDASVKLHISFTGRFDAFADIGTTRIGSFDVDLTAWVRQDNGFDTHVGIGVTKEWDHDVLAEFFSIQEYKYDARIDLGTSKNWLHDVRLKLGAQSSRFFDTRIRLGSIRHWTYDVALRLRGRQNSAFDTVVHLYAVDPSVRKKYGKLPQSVRYLRRYRGPVESERENSLVLSGLSDLRRALGLLEDLDDRLTAAQDQILFGGGHPGLYDLRLP